MSGTENVRQFRSVSPTNDVCRVAEIMPKLSNKRNSTAEAIFEWY